jgi:exopolysaccharide production protein ExoY
MSDTYFDDISEPDASIAKQRRLYVSGGKRIFDIVFVLMAMPLILPVIFFAWAITYMAGGSGFYRQARVGSGGKLFQCWKIRTMSADADLGLKAALVANPIAAEEWRRNQKLSDDPRVTGFGHLLRKTSVDEFPQFWNVLKGDMSLIGPRPFTPNQKRMYDEASAGPSYYQLRPGLSGLWQITSRSAGAFSDRAKFDDEYALNISLFNDLKIICRTIVVVLRSTGT